MKKPFELKTKYIVLKLSSMTRDEHDELRKWIEQNDIKTVDGVVIPNDWKEYPRAEALLAEGVERIQADYTRWSAYPNFYHPGSYCLKVEWQRWPNSGSINTFFKAETLPLVVDSVYSDIAACVSRREKQC